MSFYEKNETRKFAIFLILILILSAVIVYFVNDWFRTNYDPDKKQRDWYTQISNTNEEKIFLIGSSYVMRLNATVIEDFLITNNHNFSVYNLAVTADRETDRIRFIDDIIQSNPKLVVFGFGYHSFVSQQNEDNGSIIGASKTLPLFSDAEFFLRDSLSNNFNLYFDGYNLQNPKLTSLSLIKQALKEEKLHEVYSPFYKKNQPFSIDYPEGQIIKNSTELKESTKYQYMYNSFPSIENPPLVSLKKMVEKLRDNEVKVVLFIAPYHDIFWNDLEKTKYDIFLQEVENLSTELNLKIYDLHNEYSEYSIWNDMTHIVKVDNHYSNDLGMIILNELSTEKKLFPIIHMNNNVSSFGVSTYSERPFHSEFVSSKSELVGDKIDTITLKLRKIGEPNGNAQIGIFNEDLSVKKLFGTIDSSSLHNYSSEFHFSLSQTELYLIDSGDNIGIKFTHGDEQNYIEIMMDNDETDSFDAMNSYFSYYKDDTWFSFSLQDMYMILTQSNAESKDDEM